MLFNSVDFLIFFPIVLFVYFLIPYKYKHFWLLISSYYFYMCWNPKYIILILASTLLTYLGGIATDKIDRSQSGIKDKKTWKKLTVFSVILINLGILFYFKYVNFAVDVLKYLFSLLKIDLVVPAVDLLLPVGISFYTFQALSYTIDVYRGDVEVEKDFFKYALFVSFFPQLVAGPIEKSRNLLKQLNELKGFSYENMIEGLIDMLWGFFVKIVVAERIAIFVDTIYGDPVSYPGFYLIVATVLFAVQIYCDFYGYSLIAVGSAKILNVRLMDNFDTPYLSSSVSEFWRRWHISLNLWFRDYLYIPLGGNRKGRLRKYINILIVFIASGLWHGAELSFVLWGFLNGMYQVIGDLLKPLRNRITDYLNIKKNGLIYKTIQIIIVFILVDFSWIFFRAQNLKEAVDIIKLMSFENIGIVRDSSLYYCGLDFMNYWFMWLCVMMIAGSDLLLYKQIILRDMIMKQNIVVRSLIIASSVCLILVFGIWGPAFDKASFIYFQF